VAGVGQRIGISRPAAQASVHPHGIAFDPSGRIVFGTAWEGRVFSVGADGILRSVTGGFNDSDSDGRPVSETYISGPRSVGFDAAGNMYIAEQGSHRLHRVDGATGIVTTSAVPESQASPETAVPARRR
jgi:DNA-binding beta-propeller fold protein YncE